MTDSLSMGDTLGTGSKISFWNRFKKQEEIEQVYGDRLMRWVYGSKTGQTFAEKVLTRAFLSRIYGKYQSSRLSGHKVKPFIKKFRIPMEE